MEAEKQLLLGNGPYACSRGTRHATIEEVLQGKHISAAVNQHTTTEEEVFSVSLPQDYIMRISHS
jgi:hypothetical protein